MSEPTLSPLAGKLPPDHILQNIPRLLSRYYTNHPDPSDASQLVSFGTSGHRGSALESTFNDDHIAAIAQAIAEHRREQGIDGPLYLGMDTHALSEAAWSTAVEVLAANEVAILVDAQEGFTPTPTVSLAILTHNTDKSHGLADGIVITPSHNPPQDGGFKYNPPNGGPADTGITDQIQKRANEILRGDRGAIRRIPLQKALASNCVKKFDFRELYVRELAAVVDMEAIRSSGLKIGVDPLGNASTAYWPEIAERYGLDLTIVNSSIDPSFRFVCVDWDGNIRMDCSSPYAMAGLIALKDRFDIAFSNDTDVDRHGIVAKSTGLLNPNHYLAVAISYLFANRPHWSSGAGIGKTIVSSSMIDRVAGSLGRTLVEVPVGFKWFVDGLFSGSLGFGGEESAGASFLRMDGRVWTTDKDGPIMGLLAAEITARTGSDPGEHYQKLTETFGSPVYQRVDAPATKEEKARLKALSPEQIQTKELAGDPIRAMQTSAPGNGASIGGLKISSENGWFAARPSGTEDVYKIYAESFKNHDHLVRIQTEAREIVAAAIS